MCKNSAGNAPVYPEPSPEDIRLVEASGLFDEAWYRKNYLLGRPAILPPLVHFLRHGPRKGYWPNPYFDPRRYLAACPEAEASGINPLLHCLRAMHSLSRWSAADEHGLVSEKILESLWTHTHAIALEKTTLLFHRVNPLTAYRIASFFEKEPETIEWMDSFAENAIFWDIGANIGLYSLYAAKMRQATVYAFEPSIFNLELLTRNIAANEAQEKISIIPLCLSDTNTIDAFNLSTTEWGGAGAAFASDHDQHGNALRKKFTYRMPGMSADSFRALYALPAPNYVKIDVDGIEHLILAGMAETLRAPELRSLLVETSFDFPEQAETIEKILRTSGFTLERRAHAACFDNSPYAHVYNCIWRRGPGL